MYAVVHIHRHSWAIARLCRSGGSDHGRGRKQNGQREQSCAKIPRQAAKQHGRNIKANGVAFNVAVKG
jgi:hypothetical protein